MFLRLFLLFTLVPLLELAVLLRIGGLIGAWPTIGLVVATGVAGAWMARREGTRSWRAVQAELQAGRFPAEQLLHSLLVLVAGIVLVTPGIFTDLAGILLLVRPVRSGLIRRLRSRFRTRAAMGPGGAADTAGPGFGFFQFYSSGGADGPGARGDSPSGSAEGEHRGRRGTGAEEESNGAEPGTRRRPRVIEL